MPVRKSTALSGKESLIVERETIEPVTPSDHAVDCQWHCDQNPHECTCGLIPQPKPII